MRTGLLRISHDMTRLHARTCVVHVTLLILSSLRFPRFVRLPTEMEDGFQNVSDSNILNQQQMQIIGYIDLCASLLSLLGSSSILVSIIVKRESYSKDEIQPIFHLSLADWLASLFLVMCCILYTQTDKVNQGGCLFLSGVTMIFYCNTFFLTLCYAGEVLIRLRLIMQRINMREGVPTSVKIIRGVMYSLSWLLPFISGLVVVGLIFHQWIVSSEKTGKSRPVIPIGHDCSTCIPLFHYNNDICWIWTTEHFSSLRVFAKYFFLTPLLLTFAGNFVIYLVAMKLIPKIHVKRGSITSQEHAERQIVRNKAILYQLVFLLCWVPSLILGFCSMTKTFTMNGFFWLYVIQAITAPLQGFFNCFVYGWKKESFRRPFMSNTQETLLVQQNTYGAI